HPHGPTLQLSVIELPSTSKAPLGDLVMNPGGPGGSGVEFLTGEASGFPAALRSSFNLVSFDPRGVGASDPVNCLDTAGIRRLIALDPAPSTSAQISSVVAATKSFVAACKAKTSPQLLKNVSSAVTVQDMDRLRAALGQSKLNYLGFSYGTYLGDLYANRYPSHVRAMVLDGAVDPALTSTQSDLQQAQGFETDLHDFYTYCATNSTCKTELPQGAQTALHQLIAELAAGKSIPAHLKAVYGGTQPVTLGVADVALAGSLYSKQTWPQLAQAIQQGLAGDGTLLAAIAYGYEGLQANGKFDNEIAANTAINCVDRPSPTSIATYRQLAATMAKAAPDFGAGEAWGTLACAYWPVASQGKVGPLHDPGSPPILVVGSTGDPATPYRWAKAVASQLDKGELLTRTGPGHTGYFSSSCVQRATDGYLTTLALPPKGTVCPSS
ncbi:MAG: Alpha/beta hydrolase fold, partial [Acidimicrobiaceae bacterium]|nr:Alpha/beta hydrolase fold [Acidimicrobiaceae bacterium]